MKNLNGIVAMFAAIMAFNGSSGQTSLAGFDDLSLEQDSYWIGSSHGSNDFSSGFAHFSHFYDTAYFSWNGFAYSNIIDTITEGWGNQYASRAGIGAEGTSNYGIFYQWGNDSIWFDEEKVLYGMSVTNSTISALAMQNGDAFSKKFGGETGDDPDWFLLTITGFDENGNATGIVEFYLADYRSDDNSEDYIVNEWEWIDFTLLYGVKTLKFSLTSSDNGDWGMNTPAYFCFDELKSEGVNVLNISDSNDGLNIFPNPFNETINIETDLIGEISVFNYVGQCVYQNASIYIGKKIDLSHLEQGIYFFNLTNNEQVVTKRIIKQ